MAFLNTGGPIIGIIALACAIWVTYDVLTNKKSMDTLKKVIWIVCAWLVGLNIITAIVYYLIEKR